MISAAAAHRRLLALADPVRAGVSRRFFKTGPGQYGEGDRFLGISVPVLRQLAREYTELPLGAVTTLLASPLHEERLLALLILVRQYERADAAARDAIYECYMADRAGINNWDLVDSSAPQIVGAHLCRGQRRLLKKLAKSASLWDRRIAMIATLHYIRAGEFDDALAIARMLLGDREDLIHKAVGWMLREIGQRDRQVLEDFLDLHAPIMPRTALRYAIERFPGPVRRRYLAVDRRVLE